jgi:hypothetical protein
MFKAITSRLSQFSDVDYFNLVSFAGPVIHCISGASFSISGIAVPDSEEDGSLTEKCGLDFSRLHDFRITRGIGSFPLDFF